MGAFSLTSFNFIVFFLATIIFYYVIPNKMRWLWLLFSSMAFYVLSCGYRALFFIISAVFVSYISSNLISIISSFKIKRFVLLISILLLVGQLFFIKESGLLTSIVALMNPLKGFSPIDLTVPIGISYFTLSLIGYVVDVYRDTTSPQKNILRHALFGSYFPLLTSGPIVRYTDMSHQLFDGNNFSIGNVSMGLKRMLFGYFKKMVIADRLATVVLFVYNDTESFGGFYLVIATLCYAFQLYTDFSGCIDIIIGASETLGIKLPENFKSPFYSLNISEFWRRWHITLGLWFKDYVFYPLLKTELLVKVGIQCKKQFGKKIGKNIPTYLGLFLLWGMIGLWHGGTFKWMLASGLLPFSYILMSETLGPLCKKMVQKLKIIVDCTSYRVFQRFRTLTLMCICWVFVCTSNIGMGINTYKSIFFSLNPLTLVDGGLFELGLDSQELIITIFGIIVVLFIDYIKYKGENAREVLGKQNIVFQYLILWIIALSIMFFGITNGSPFIYFQF